ncbi:S9 family peptidase [Massilia cavernae]|uniref:S9 family peptidase n=1 Tax=Massilia cavernae TaxID=2320864 RepID=A0A418XRQ9_9BURK|nr:alpha/beta fold hydrolase [Massilia cavernae]RJG15226.1 S9 family peptidase [Massilia cavernae]
MSLPFTRAIGLCVFALVAGGFPAAYAADARSPVERFFENAELDGAVLSPDGRSLAMRVAKRGQRSALTVIDLATDKVISSTRFTDVDIGKVRWVNKGRLIFDTIDLTVGQADWQYGPGLYAVDRNGGKLRLLAERRSYPGPSNNSGRPQKVQKVTTFMMNQDGAQDSDSVYVYSPNFAGVDGISHVNLMRLDTYSGKTALVPRPDHAQSWLLDERGEPRLAVAADDGIASIHYRDHASGEWRKSASFGTFIGKQDVIRPLAFGPDGILYVVAAAGKDKTAVHAFDLAAGKVSGKPLVVTEDHDFSGRLIIGQGKLLGVRVTTDGENTVWFDEGMKAMQARIDQRLPDTVNLVSLPARPETPWVLVESYSDVQPKAWSLFNSETGAIKPVGASRPGIKASQMGRQQTVSYAARDGLQVPAVLTLPPGGQRTGLPLIVLVHGGPFIRGSSWGWTQVPQFLASRGYAVIEPEFRGSRGFGHAHFRAGWKQYGMAMQDDLADGAKWAVAQGVADPNRVCIVGASYGGYAALMGLAKDRDIFKCGIASYAVTEMSILTEPGWFTEGETMERYRKYVVPQLIGDPDKEAALLKAASPLEHAGRITQPLLLSFGGADRRVPLRYGERFHAAVKKNNPNVEWIAYPREGHGWVVPENKYDYWTRVEKFLDKHIGKP